MQNIDSLILGDLNNIIDKLKSSQKARLTNNQEPIHIAGDIERIQQRIRLVNVLIQDIKDL